MVHVTCRGIRFEQLKFLNARNPRAAFDQSVVLEYCRQLDALRHVTGVEVRPLDALRRLGQELQQQSARAPVASRATGARSQLLGDSQAHPGGDLLRAQKILVRGTFEALAPR